MKQSHRLRCEIVTLIAGADLGRRIQNEVQRRLDLGWTLRAAPAISERIHLVFVRKETKQP